ncbi:hypothetical protein [Paraburkholderia acidisoli]|uniref:Uncharacterized protein n=1 Tax=Paraburkholderia acidisoli TaxID=2571748 RepID=A0A7Z2GNN4_9BURK|nr:hypothetical protein [Paraburkholderia acidisoli]QGZ65117.1 hypothetical protein FAZ98_25380 [Paraburkholderia acidisoli]
MEAKSLIPLHIAPDLNQVRLALVDCARQLRYTARNVPGSESAAARVPTPHGSFPKPLPQFLGSVGQIADTLLETAETYAGQAIPPLQDHWKLPVHLDVDLERLLLDHGDAKRLRSYASLYYAAAKRFILNAGARDVLIFEHRINDALAEFCERHEKLPAPPEAVVSGPASADTLHDAAHTFAGLTLALIDKHPIRSARFDELPDVIAPWWLIAEPNAYVFLLLGLIGCAKAVRPEALPADADGTLHLAGDIVGSRESRLRDLLGAPNAQHALQQEFARIVNYL